MSQAAKIRDEASQNNSDEAKLLSILERDLGIVHMLHPSILELARPQKWETVAELKSGRTHFAVAVSPDGSKIFAAGGADHSGLPSDTVEYYNFATESWEELPQKMHCKRRGLGVTMSPDGKKLYAVGGDGLASCECYDFTTSRWEELPAMGRKRASAGVAMSPDGRRMFAVGGSLIGREIGYQQWNTVECFDFEEGKWRDLPQMSSRRESPIVSICPGGRRLAVCGQESSDSEYDTIECFDLEERSWITVPKMTLPRKSIGFAMSPDGKRLYAVGGHRPNGDCDVTLFEFFDFDTWEWKELRPLKTTIAEPKVTISPDSTKLYVMGKTLRQGHVIASYDFEKAEWGEIPRTNSKEWKEFIMSPDGKTLCSLDTTSHYDVGKLEAIRVSL